MNARLPSRRTFSGRAFVTGLLLATLSFASILSWTNPTPRAQASPTIQVPGPRDEHVAFITVNRDPGISAPAAQKIARALPERVQNSTTRQPAASVVIEPIPSAEQPPASSSAVVPQASRLTIPAPSWRNSDVLRPYAKEPSLPASLSAAERDSANKAFARAVTARVPTQEEQDAAQREAGYPGTIPGRRVGEQGGHSLGGGSRDVPISIFTPGPSRAQRTRDSIAHAENLERLARLKARAQAKRDSTPR